MKARSILCSLLVLLLLKSNYAIAFTAEIVANPSSSGLPQVSVSGDDFVYSTNNALILNFDGVETTIYTINDPAVGGGVYQSHREYFIDKNGAVIFRVAVLDGSNFSTPIYRFQNGTITALFDENTLWPDTSTPVNAALANVDSFVANGSYAIVKTEMSISPFTRGLLLIDTTTGLINVFRTGFYNNIGLSSDDVASYVESNLTLGTSSYVLHDIASDTALPLIGNNQQLPNMPAGCALANFGGRIRYDDGIVAINALNNCSDQRTLLTNLMSKPVDFLGLVDSFDPSLDLEPLADISGQMPINVRAGLIALEYSLVSGGGGVIEVFSKNGSVVVSKGSAPYPLDANGVPVRGGGGTLPILYFQELNNNNTLYFRGALVNPDNTQDNGIVKVDLNGDPNVSDPSAVNVPVPMWALLFLSAVFFLTVYAFNSRSKFDW